MPLILKIVLAMLILAIIVEGSLMLAVYIAGEIKRPLVESDAIVVLGARVMPEGHLSTTLMHRMNKALSIYEQGYAEYIVTCGGQGENEPVAEADAMAEYLIEKGVPEDRILRDTQSTDTVQNLTNAKALLDERGLQSVIVVTSEYHLTRALWIADDVGIKNATGAGSLGQNLVRNRLKANFRETFSWMNYWSGGLLGRISHLTGDTNE